MKIVINNVPFSFDMGCKVLKLRGGECPFNELESFWEDIIPATFEEIAKLENLEQRRIGMLNFGLERLTKEINPKLLSSKTIKKKNTWVNENGELVEFEFDDTYELYEVSGSHFSKGLSGFQRMENCYYVKCKDTSTDREYLIWVDLRDVYNTNFGTTFQWRENISKIDPIHCIAWTIQTDVPENKIEKIIRQGDCILIKPKGDYIPENRPRHLLKSEYLKYIVAES